MKSQIRSDGFTLIETILVVALVGIIAAFGVPFIMKTIRRDKLATPVQNVYTLFQRARNRAIRQNAVIGVNMDESVLGVSNTGRVVFQMFQDNNANEVYDVGEEILAQGSLAAGTQYVLPLEVALRRQDNSIGPGSAYTLPGDAANGLGTLHNSRIFFRPDGSVSSSSQSYVALNVLPNPLQLLPTGTSRGEIYLADAKLDDTSGNPRNTFRLQIEAPVSGRVTVLKFAHADPSAAPRPIPADTFLRAPFVWYYQ